jgi:hypothetical protein
MSSSCLHVDKNQLGQAQSLSEDEWNVGKAHFPNCAPPPQAAFDLLFSSAFNTNAKIFFFFKDQSFHLPTDCFRNTFLLAVATFVSVDGRHYYLRATPRQLTSVVYLFLEQNSCYVYVLLNMNYYRLL